jgi:hypothetical protein
LWTLHTASFHIPSASASGQTSEVEPAHDQTPPEFNGDVKKGPGTDEDHEPATI